LEGHHQRTRTTQKFRVDRKSGHKQTIRQLRNLLMGPGTRCSMARTLWETTIKCQIEGTSSHLKEHLRSTARRLRKKEKISISKRGNRKRTQSLTWVSAIARSMRVLRVTVRTTVKRTTKRRVRWRSIVERLWMIRKRRRVYWLESWGAEKI